MTHTPLPAGGLALIVGPSGVGKYTLIDGAKARLLDDPSFVFPRRYITRPDNAGGEDHIALTPDAFSDREQSGGFFLSWRAHGLSYGIGALVRDHLETGRVLVVNVSRAVLDEARAKAPRLRIFSITAPAPAIEQRLKARGRESDDMIADRIARAAAYRVTGPDVVEIMNDGAVDASIDMLVSALQDFSNNA